MWTATDFRKFLYKIYIINLSYDNLILNFSCFSVQSSFLAFFRSLPSLLANLYSGDFVAYELATAPFKFNITITGSADEIPNFPAKVGETTVAAQPASTVGAYMTMFGDTLYMFGGTGYILASM
jgi:hypothetical protein